jgi:hypothetical protein
LKKDLEALWAASAARVAAGRRLERAEELIDVPKMPPCLKAALNALGTGRKRRRWRPRQSTGHSFAGLGFQGRRQRDMLEGQNGAAEQVRHRRPNAGLGGRKSRMEAPEFC